MTPDAVAALVGLGPFDLSDLPASASGDGWQVLVDALAVDVDDHELVVTVRPAGAVPDGPLPALVDGRGGRHPAVWGDRGQLRFGRVPAGPWRFVVAPLPR